MPLTISVPDSLRQSVEAATGGKNTVLYDAQGNPSVMVVIPRFFLEDLDSSMGAGAHPAFKYNGKDLNYIFIAKYESSWAGNLPVSIPRVKISSSTKTFDDCLAATRAKGPGWHIMTQAEWAALSLWCKKAGYSPTGNNNSGCNLTYPQQRGIPSGDTGLCLTGSGPKEWYHDGTYEGIADLIGNGVEWVSGLQMLNGEIQIIPYNNAAGSSIDLSPTSSAWKAIHYNTGEFITPGSDGTLKINYSNGTSNIVFSFSTPNYRGTYTNLDFTSFGAESGVSSAVITLLQTYGLKQFSWSSGAGVNRWNVCNLADGIYRIPLRTQFTNQTTYQCGMWSMDWTYTRSRETQTFRLAHFIQ
jgi:hypothetical protein